MIDAAAAGGEDEMSDGGRSSDSAQVDSDNEEKESVMLIMRLDVNIWHFFIQQDILFSVFHRLLAKPAPLCPVVFASTF